MLDGWLVVFTGPKLIDELRRSSDDELSAVEGTTQVGGLSPPGFCFLFLFPFPFPTTRFYPLLPIPPSSYRLASLLIAFRCSNSSGADRIRISSMSCFARVRMHTHTQVLQLRHTLGPGIDDQFHVAVVRDKLTRNLAAVFPDVLDEVCAAFREYIPVPPNEDGAYVVMRLGSGCESCVRVLR